MKAKLSRSTYKKDEQTIIIVMITHVNDDTLRSNLAALGFSSMPDLSNSYSIELVYTAREQMAKVQAGLMGLRAQGFVD